MNPNITFNKPAHYMLDYGDILVIYVALNWMQRMMQIAK